MLDPIDALAGVRAFGFTGKDQYFKVPPKVTTVWLSGIGGSGAVPTGQFGEWIPRGIANMPLAVEPGSHIRVRVGGRPDILGRYDESPGGVYWEWKLSTNGGWNGGGNGGGTWERGSLGGFGEIHACGGGGATTFHLIPPEANPLSTVGDLVAVTPGAPGTLRGFLGSLGVIELDSGVMVDFLAYDVGGNVSLSAAAAFSFTGEPPPVAGAPEDLGSYTEYDLLPIPTTTPLTPWWHDIELPIEVTGGSGGSLTFDGPSDVSLGNPGESFKGGPGRRFGGATATAGGGGGYGGGASGARLVVTGQDATLIPGPPRDLTFDLAMEARHGGFLLPVERPEGWEDRDPIEADGTIMMMDAGGVEAPLLYLPVASAGDANPFGAYEFTEADFQGDNPDTLLGHGSARIQWARDRKPPGWHVGRIGWGRNNGW